MTTRKQLLKSPVILDLIYACLNCTRIIENKEFKNEAFLKEIHLALGDVYAKSLPFMELEFNKPDQFINPDEEFPWEEKPNILEKLGGEITCLELHLPIIVGESDILRHLSDNLSTIYDCIKKLINLISIDTKDSIASALEYFQHEYEHWGSQCLIAMRVIHTLRFEYNEVDDAVWDILKHRA